MGFWTSMMKAAPNLYHLSPEQVDRIARGTEELVKHNHGIAFLLGIPKPEGVLYGSALMLARVDDSQAALAANEKYIRQFNEVVKGSEGPLQPMEIEKTRIEGQPGYKMVMAMPKVPAGPAAQQTETMFKHLFSPDGKLVTYSATADRQTLITGYTDTELLVRALKLVKTGGPGLAADKNVVAVGKLLPPQAAVKAFISPQGVLEVVHWLTSLAAGPNFPFSIPKLPATPPLGLAVWSTPANLQVQIVVPVEVLQAVADIVRQRLGM
jgi:hypothetical protein